MRRLSSITLAGVLLLAISGCSTESTGDPAATTTPVIIKQPAKTQPFAAKPVVPARPRAGGAVAGLTQSTNDDQRAQQVQTSINAQRRSGRDPFATLPPLSLPVTPVVATPTRNTSAPVARRVPVQPLNQPINPRQPNVATGTPITPTLNTLPPLPEPDLARAVEVTGVVQVRGTLQAIVKAPNEQTSRYVQVGQRLSNGEILVKRIEMNRGSDPIVILEQNGVEVAKAVGEKAPTPAGAPTAAVLRTPKVGIS